MMNTMILLIRSMRIKISTPLGTQMNLSTVLLPEMIEKINTTMLTPVIITITTTTSQVMVIK